jgi:peptide/nickel transport system substrate-binding protein
MRLRTFVVISMLLLVTLFITQCAAPASPAPQPEAAQPAETGGEVAAPAAEEAAPAETAAGPQGSLTVALTTFPNSLDPANTSERQASNAARHLYNSLVFLERDGTKSPALAESWEVSEDGSEYTFHLRQDVVFHNGEPFNADAVVFSWERGKQPENQWSDRWALATSVEKIDDYTVKITTDGPNPLFLSVVATSWAMFPPGYINEVGEEGFAAHPIGTGPFVFEEWAKGDRIVFKANPNYWQDGIPKLETLTFRPIPESATRVAAIQTGEVDIVTRLSAEEADSLQGVPGVNVISYPVDRVYYIAFNNLTTGVGQPTEDPLVRQAMNYAVDVDAIIEALFNGNGRPSTGYVTPANLGYDETLQPFGYDPDKARELLAQAGYPDGFSMDMACPSGAYTNFEQVCEAVQGYLADVGIDINLELMESGRYWELEAAKELPPLFGDSWSESSGEALPRLQGALGGWDASFSAWSDPKIDELLAKISVTVDDQARAELYKELQRYMHDNPPFIYLYEPVTFEAVRDRVQGYDPRPSEEYFLEFVSVSE